MWIKYNNKSHFIHFALFSFPMAIVIDGVGCWKGNDDSSASFFKLIASGKVWFKST